MSIADGGKVAVNLHIGRSTLGAVFTSFLAAGALNAQDEVVSGHRVARWLDVGAEFRARGELETFQFPGLEENRLGMYSRARLGIQATATSWLRFAAEFQDARTLSGPDEAVLVQDNHSDLQYAYVDIGAEDGGGWRIRVGRQPLAFGDERLVGADSLWSNRAQRFDGVRMTVKWSGWHWDAFSVTATPVLPGGFDKFTSPERLSGLYGSWSLLNTVVEPYVLWNRVSGASSSLLTPGARLATRVTSRMDIIAEGALQRGTVASAPVAAWAAYAEGGYRLGENDKSPRLSLSYSHATGDEHAHDGRAGTFNDLHPAGYNSCGFLEPFAWRNIRDLRFGGEWSGPHSWHMRADFHADWLATVADGLYVDEGPFVAYNPGAGSSRLGSRLVFMAQHNLGAHSYAAFGYGRFWAAEYLKQGMSRSNSAFVSWNLSLMRPARARQFHLRRTPASARPG